MRTNAEVVVSDFLGSLRGGSREGLVRRLHPDVTWWLAGDLPHSGSWTGLEEVFEFQRRALAHFEPGTLSIRVTNVFGDERQVAAEWTTEGRTTRGDAYENRYAALFAVTGDRIHTVREYTDTRLMARLFGYPDATRSTTSTS